METMITKNQAVKSQRKRTLRDKEEFKTRLRRLKEAVNAEQLLRHLGFNITNINSSEIRAACKVHGGDNKTAFRMNQNTKTWTCYSHGCQEDVGYDVISLVENILNINFAEAVKYIENITGINIDDELDYVKYQEEQDRLSFIQQRNDNRIAQKALVTEAYLKDFKKFRSKYFNVVDNGGFTDDMLNEFEVGGGYVDRYGFQRDVIPIRDKDGVLVSCSFRDITDKADYSFKYILTKGFDKDKVLYNLFEAQKHIGNSRTLVVVEGFKSVWRLREAGYKNVVACMGSYITTGQQKLLYSTAFRVIIMLDADEAGVKGTTSAIKDMAKNVEIIPVFLPHTGKDPSDYTKEELLEILGGLND